MPVLSRLFLLQRVFGASYSARTLLVPLMLNNGSLEHVCGLNPLQEILISFGLKKKGNIYDLFLRISSIT